MSNSTSSTSDRVVESVEGPKTCPNCGFPIKAPDTPRLMLWLDHPTLTDFLAALGISAPTE